MSIPVFLQFLSTIQKWVRLEKEENKKWSWLLLLFQCWPQWRAIRIINLTFKNDKKAEEKRKKLMREVTSTEPYLEAWPSIIIMTVIWTSVGSVGLPPKKQYCDFHPENNACAVYGGFGGSYWFFTTYSISVITCSLGITKFLQVGPFSVLSNEGAFGGIFKWRFLLAFLAVMFSIIAKGVFIGLSINMRKYFFIERELGASGDTQSFVSMSALLFGLLIIPNLIFAFGSIASSTGLNRKFFKIIFNYPQAWMLPVATHFTIGSPKISCSSNQKCLKNELGLSKKLTAINMTLTVLIYVLFITYFYLFTYITFSTGYNKFAFGVFFVPVLALSLLFNIIYLLLDEKCCCSRSTNCLCSSCCGSDCFEHEIYVIDTKSENLDIVPIENLSNAKMHELK